MTSESLVPANGYPPPDRGVVVVWGLLGGYPFGGMTWQVLHYLAGLRRLGLDVWYVEDIGDVMATGSLDWGYDPMPNVRYLASRMDEIGLGDRWIYRPYGDRGDWYGNGGDDDVARLYRIADAAFNICGFRYVAPAEGIEAPLVYVDTDPGERQVAVATDVQWRIEELDQYAVLATYAENLGTVSCRLPATRYEWVPTRPPVIMDWWAADLVSDATPFTTISHWSGVPDKWLEWEGKRYEWRKDKLFRRVMDVAAQSPRPLELALRAINATERDELETAGWRIADAADLDPPEAYRAYICGSAGEFTIAKEQYTKLGTGWFSDRSVCYLAAGRPVITEDTGFGRNLPSGEGLFAFTDSDSALSAIEAVASDYPRHARAAREIAREFFATDRVLTDLCKRVGLL